MYDVKRRLEYLRSQIQANAISYDEIVELRMYAEHIDPSDVELLEWRECQKMPKRITIKYVPSVWRINLWQIQPTVNNHLHAWLDESKLSVTDGAS